MNDMEDREEAEKERSDPAEKVLSEELVLPSDPPDPLLPKDPPLLPEPNDPPLLPEPSEPVLIVEPSELVPPASDEADELLRNVHTGGLTHLCAMQSAHMRAEETSLLCEVLELWNVVLREAALLDDDDDLEAPTIGVAQIGRPNKS